MAQLTISVRKSVDHRSIGGPRFPTSDRTHKSRIVGRRAISSKGLCARLAYNAASMNVCTVEEVAVDETRYDIFVPVEISSAMGFYGRPERSVSTNDEKAFSLLAWQASFHDAASGSRYVIVRTNCSELEARDIIKKIIAALPFVSAILDVGLRVTSNQIMVGSCDVDINRIFLFISGISPHPYGASGHLKVNVSTEELTQAFSGAMGVPETSRRAAEVFADVDFEASTTSRMVLIATVLELICSRATRDNDALALIESWKKCAQEASRGDLVTALDLMKEESISSAIRNEVKAACARAGIGDEDANGIAKRTVALYRKRSSVVHRGATVSGEEVAELRHYVRFLLTGTRERGPFSGVLGGIERDKVQ